MNTRSLIPAMFAMLILALGLILSPVPTLAHSTKGLVKAPLDLDQIGVDDVAFFIESYVHRTLYSDGTANTQNRYVVKDFIAVEQQGDQATVRFITLDKSNNRDLEDSVALHRASDGKWFLHPKDGTALEMFTYMSKNRYLWKQNGTKISLSFALVCGGLAAALWLGRQKEAALARADQTQNTATPAMPAPESAETAPQPVDHAT